MPFSGRPFRSSPRPLTSLAFDGPILREKEIGGRKGFGGKSANEKWDADRKWSTASFSGFVGHQFSAEVLVFFHFFSVSSGKKDAKHTR